MKIKTIITTLFFVLFSAMLIPGMLHVIAEDDIDDLQDKIDKYERKIIELQGRASTLANEIEYMDSQINLTELKIRDSIVKIAKTEEKIKELTADINDLSLRIDKLQKSIDYQKSVLQARMRERYKDVGVSDVMFIFGSDTMNIAAQKLKYLQELELQDNRMIDDMSRTKQSFSLQKKLFEEKKNEEEDLKNQLEVEKVNLDYYKSTLENQKREKNRLLEITQNDEQKYQKLLNEAQKELDQISQAAGVVIREGNSVKVDKGEVIGTMGNSGFSTGAHLHFGVYKYKSKDFDSMGGWDWYYSNYKNPIDKLKSKTVTWDTGCYLDSSGARSEGRGDWDWPMSSPVITQNYGNNTCYNWMYGGKAHPALDMISYGDISIHAVEDGDAYFCRNCLGDGGNGVFVFHDDGYMSLYWHLQ